MFIGYRPEVVSPTRTQSHNVIKVTNHIRRWAFTLYESRKLASIAKVEIDGISRQVSIMYKYLALPGCQAPSFLRIFLLHLHPTSRFNQSSSCFFSLNILTMRYSASIKVLLLAAAFQVVHGVAIPSPVEQQQLLSPDGYPIAVQTFSEINFADGLTLKIYDAPAGQSTNPTEIVKKDLTKRDSHCSGSTFIGRTSTGSPDRLDCHNLRQKFRDAPTLLSWTQRSSIQMNI